MKVIKRGKKYKEVTCDFCEAVIAYENSDIQDEDAISRTNLIKPLSGNTPAANWNLNTIKYIICPECNHKIYIEKTLER